MRGLIMYKVEVNRGVILGKKVYRFLTLEKTQEFTEKYFDKTGDILQISSVRNYRGEHSYKPRQETQRCAPSAYARKDGIIQATVVGKFRRERQQE